MVKKWSGGNPIKALAILPTILRWEKVFHSFTQKYLNLSEKTYTSLIDNAKYVLTDSFHATAFSLNLHTEPICVYPKEFGGRLESILQQTNQTQRHIADYSDFDVVNRPVDFDYVGRILEGERRKANEFLKEVVKEAARL